MSNLRNDELFNITVEGKTSWLGHPKGISQGFYGVNPDTPN